MDVAFHCHNVLFLLYIRLLCYSLPKWLGQCFDDDDILTFYLDACHMLISYYDTKVFVEMDFGQQRNEQRKFILRRHAC